MPFQQAMKGYALNMTIETFSRRRLLARASGLAIIALGSSNMLPSLAATQLTGAGATFPYPFFPKRFTTIVRRTPT